MKIIGRILALFRTTLFLGIMCVSLAVTTISFGISSLTLGTQVTAMGVSAAAAAIAQRQAVATAVLKTKTREKAKARLKRLLVALPVVGIAAAAAFEYGDYLEWQEDNPEGDLGTYGCEVATLSAEVVDEVLQDLPEATRPPRELVLSQLPDCAAAPGGDAGAGLQG